MKAMNGTLHETLEEMPTALPPDRSTGLVLAAASGIAAALMWRTLPAAAVAGAVAAVALGGLSLAAPGLLRPLNVAWMGLAAVLGRIVSPIVMLVMFVTTIVPFGLAMQLKRDPLRKRHEGTGETYWIVPEIKFGPNDMTRQF
jgi:hypothetical protein